MIAALTVTEFDVTARCDSLAEQLGVATERYEQRRASRICEGIPDRAYLPGGRRLWCEMKKPGGQLTEAQHRWLLAELAAGGFATVIDDAQQLASLFTLLQRNSSIADSEVRRRCRELVHLAVQRGYRPTKSTRAQKKKTGGRG